MLLLCVHPFPLLPGQMARCTQWLSQSSDGCVAGSVYKVNIAQGTCIPHCPQLQKSGRLKYQDKIQGIQAQAQHYSMVRTSDYLTDKEYR